MSTHNAVAFRCLKNYSVNGFIDILKSLDFPNYENFTNVDYAYRDFHMKLMESIEKIAPSKVSRIKNKTPEWFDLEVADKIKLRIKRFKKI